MAGKPQHWKERNGRYSARIVVPLNLRPYIQNRAELEIQLGGDRRTALRNHASAVASIQRQIGIARLKYETETGNAAKAPSYPLTAQQIALRDYQAQIDFDSQIRAHDHRYAQVEPDPQFDAQPFRDGFAGKLSDDELDVLVGDRVRLFQLAGNTSALRGSDEWREVAQALCVSTYEAVARRYERNDGEFNGVPSHPLLANSSKEIEDELKPMSLDKLFADYSANRKKVGKGLEAVRRWAPVFEDLKTFLGHDDINMLTDEKVREWRDEKLDTLSPATVGKVYLPALRTVLNWAIENKRITKNAAAEVRQEVPRRQLSREQGYTLPEAVAILKAARDYAPNVMDNGQIRELPKTSAAKKWAPWLCAFSGARVTEITQLRKKDFRREGDTVVMRITPEAGGVKVGNYRDVPLHAQIIELGFMTFVDTAPEGPLFVAGDNKENPKAAARAVSGRISEWLQELKLVPEGVDPSHAWRHRFKTVSTDEDISKRVVDAIQGHASKTAGDDYGDVTLKARKRAIERMPRYDLPSSATSTRRQPCGGFKIRRPISGIPTPGHMSRYRKKIDG